MTCLYQCWPNSLTHICGTRGDELTQLGSLSCKFIIIFHTIFHLISDFVDIKPFIYVTICDETAHLVFVWYHYSWALVGLLTICIELRLTGIHQSTDITHCLYSINQQSSLSISGWLLKYSISCETMISIGLSNGHGYFFVDGALAMPFMKSFR